MFKKLWDSLVQKAVEQMLAAIFLATTTALGASAALLQWTETPWHWRRFIMAATATLCYWSVLRFAPRWMIPSAATATPEIRADAEFDGDLLLVRIRNSGPTDDFVAELTYLGGMISPWPTLPCHLRWHQYATERREIIQGGTQYLEVFRVPFEEHGDSWTIQPFLLLLTTGEVSVKPGWVRYGLITETILLPITIHAIKQGTQRHLHLEVNVAAAESMIHRAAVVVSAY